MTRVPDLGRTLAEFMAARVVGASYDELSRKFSLTFEQVKALLDVHGDPPKVVTLPLARVRGSRTHAAMTAPGE